MKRQEHSCGDKIALLPQTCKMLQRKVGQALIWLKFSLFVVAQWETVNKIKPVVSFAYGVHV